MNAGHYAYDALMKEARRLKGACDAYEAEVKHLRGLMKQTSTETETALRAKLELDAHIILELQDAVSEAESKANEMARTLHALREELKEARSS